MSDITTDSDTFEDPLENYDAQTYSDPLEEAIAERTVAELQHQPHASVGPDELVVTAVAQLASQHVACLTVEENGKLVGLFTDRDVLTRVALDREALQLTVRDVMTENPVFVYAEDPVAATLCVMAVSGYRHVPVLNTAKKVVGIVSPQRVTKFLSKWLEKPDD